MFRGTVYRPCSKRSEGCTGSHRDWGIMNAWYAELTRPPLTPPNWVFGPVWTVLYIMILCSIILYYRSATRQQLPLTTIILIVHIITNFSWTFLFFRLQSPLLALLDIIVLDVTLVALLVLLWKVSMAASVLLMPYMLWVSFATYLNAGFYVLNKG